MMVEIVCAERGGSTRWDEGIWKIARLENIVNRKSSWQRN